MRYLLLLFAHIANYLCVIYARWNYWFRMLSLYGVWRLTSIFIWRIIRPHGSITYVDAAYCYRPSSVVCRSVCLSVCHTSEPCNNGWTDRDAAWVVGLDLPRNHVLDEHPHVLRDVAMATIFVFLYMGCTLAPSGEYDSTVREWRRCSLMSNCFDHLFLHMTDAPSSLFWNLINAVMTFSMIKRNSLVCKFLLSVYSAPIFSSVTYFTTLYISGLINYELFIIISALKRDAYIDLNTWVLQTLVMAALLSRLRLDVCHAFTHGVALVRIEDAGLKRAARGSLKYRTQKIAKKFAICMAQSHNFVELYLYN